MIFIGFGLLRSPYWRISYLLADIKVRLKTWQPIHNLLEVINVMRCINPRFTYLLYLLTYLFNVQI